MIFAKEPVPGQVKTRLCPPLTPQAAAQLYSQFLEDVLEEMTKLSRTKAGPGLHSGLGPGIFPKCGRPRNFFYPPKGGGPGGTLAAGL